MNLTENRQSAKPELANTRQILLDSAADIFARKGFRNTTIREICEKAGTNIAAVNYHFRDKEGLYREVLRETMERAQAVYPLFGQGLRSPTPADRERETQSSGGAKGAVSDEAKALRNFVHSYLRRIFDEGPYSLHGKLVAREMIEPTEALDDLVAEEFRPVADYLLRILGPLLGRDPGDEVVSLCGMSVVSQCLFYHHCKAVVAKLFPEMRFGPEEIARLTEHITQFSLAGINQKRLERR